jgi:hypothetical protein
MEGSIALRTVAESLIAALPETPEAAASVPGLSVASIVS